MASGGGAARMDPEAATELVRKGATLLFLDVPQRMLFGIDTQVFSVGPKFKGIKMVPPGPHFVYYCSLAEPHQGQPGPWPPLGAGKC